jgi:alpha-1,3-glucosyltransferase
LGFYAVMGVWHALDTFIAPPSGKPDLWVVVNVGVGAVGFIICYLWCLGRLVVESEILPKKDGKAKTQ